LAFGRGHLAATSGLVSKTTLLIGIAQAKSYRRAVGPVQKQLVSNQLRH
jgi:hypothetical protein